ncbi:MAG: class I SAM-dependent methyltransferase [Ruminiclostridium sp.]
MQELTLSPRLQAAAGMVRKGGEICDVGTDHALLPCRLYLDGERKLTAADINEGPLLSAKQTVMHYIGKEDAVRLVLSDGLDKIDYADDVIIAGMGGELIARIISGCRFLSENTHFILQPMTKAEVLRRELYKNGFYIEKELTAKENDRNYVIMSVYFGGEKCEITDAFAYAGKVTDKEYLTAVCERLNRAGENCATADISKSKRLLDAARETEKIIKTL